MLGATLSSTAQRTFYSSRPLHTPDSGKNDDFRSSRTCTPPLLVSIKGGGRHHLLDDLIIRTHVTSRTPAPSLLSSDIGTRFNHLAEAWEFPSLSRLAYTPYCRHPRCKIVQCIRTPLLDVRPRGRNQDKPHAFLCYLLHQPSRIGTRSIFTS